MKAYGPRAAAEPTRIPNRGGEVALFGETTPQDVKTIQDPSGHYLSHWENQSHAHGTTQNMGGHGNNVRRENTTVFNIRLVRHQVVAY